MKGRSEAGFSLVETLIATAIVATMTAMVFGTIAINARTARTISERRAAVLVAKSVLDLAIAAGKNPQVGHSGTSGPFQWAFAIEAYKPGGDGAPSLDLVTVKVQRAGSLRQVLQLRSLRISR